ncbi:MAG: hypothetical protein KCHDKBKB_00880 [Elusimicrobia bacterium]|nr:hypothetical protein [Elusimicrobiota bacterium]
MQTLTRGNKNSTVISPRKVWGGMTVLFVFSQFVFAGLNVQTPEDKILAKGFAAYMDGANKQALSYFEEVIRINPKNKAAHQGLEKVKIRLKKAEDEKIARALQLSKSKVREGREFLKSNDVVGAIDSFHAALDATPSYKPARAELTSIKNRMQKISDRKKLNLTTWAFARGVLAYLDRDWAKAYRIWSERSRMEPDNVPLSNATARAENNFKKMMVAEQEDFFRRGGRAFYEQGLYKEAQDSWGKVLALRPDDIEALEGQARAEEAILRIQGKGRSNELHDLLEQGLQAYASQDWKRSLSLFQQLVDLDPEFSTAKEYIAKINERMTRSDYVPSVVAGETLFRRARPSNQGNETVQVPDKLENFSDRKRELESQLKRDPGNINIQRELDLVTRAQDDESEKIYKEGLIAYSQGNRVMAIQQWKQVLVINPEHKKAAAALKKARAEEERSAEGGAE